MKITQIIMSTFILVAMACGSSKDSASNDQNSGQANQQAPANENPQAENATTTSQPPSNAMTESEQAAAKQEAVKYRLILSFISIGEGIDATARTTMDNILQKWEAKAGKKLTMETYPWGREGEVDFCFQLTELDPVDQAALAREFREAFQLRPLVQISEYQESMHKR